MPMLQDFVLETSSNPGVGDFVLNGAAQDRVSFSQAFPNGGRVFYFADDGTQAEWGIGTLTVGPPATLARSTVIGNTIGGTGVLRFTSGVEVYNEVPAQFMPLLDEAGGLTLDHLSVQTVALVPAVTDWKSRQAVGASDADGRYVSRSESMSAGDSPGIALFYSESGAGPWFVSSPWVGRLAKKSEVDTVAAYVVNTNDTAQEAFTTANQALTAANNANGNKLDAKNGTAENLIVAYGSMKARFQDDGDFVLYSGDTPVFSVSSGSISWNGHSFAFLDSLPMDSSQKIQMDVVSAVAAGSRVNFPSSFSAIPKVMAQNAGSGDANCHASNPDAGGFTLHINNGGSSDITYIAIGNK